jgi:hypothetical protein
MPEGHDAEALRRTARQRFNVSLGGDFQAERTRVPHWALASERADGAGLFIGGGDEPAHQQRPARQGGVDAAMDYLAEPGYSRLGRTISRTTMLR